MDQIPLLRGLRPALPRTAPREGVRAAVGAAAGLLVCTGLALLLGWGLVAPLGASAVLVFAVPNSPLAQPWSAVAGNTVAALVAVAAVAVVPAPWAGPVAVAVAIGAMMLCRALHPPGGAVALLAALGGAGPEIVPPVFGATVTLVAAGVAWNRLTGRVYPFRQVDDGQALARRLGLSAAELRDLLARFNQSANMGVADLARLFAAAEREATAHRFDRTPCAAIMTADPATLSPDAPLAEAAALFRRHGVKSLPVVDRGGRLLGLVLQADLVATLAPGGRPAATLRAADVMGAATDVVTPATPAGALVEPLAQKHVQAVPVVDGGRLVGIVTRSDLVALLLRGAAPAA